MRCKHGKNYRACNICTPKEEDATLGVFKQTDMHPATDTAALLKLTKGDVHEANVLQHLISVTERGVPKGSGIEQMLDAVIAKNNIGFGPGIKDALDYVTLMNRVRIHFRLVVNECYTDEEVGAQPVSKWLTKDCDGNGWSTNDE